MSANVRGPEYNEDVKADREHVTLKLDGELFDEHTVPAEMFAESVLALAKAYRRADAIASPQKRNIQVAITANQPGSFEAVIAVMVPDLIDQARALLTGTNTQAVLNAGGLTALFASAFGAVKWLSGRTIAAVEQIDKVWTLIRTTDGDSLRVRSGVEDLISDAQLRTSMDEFTSPLEEEGVDSVSLHSPGEETVVTGADREAFSYVADDEDIEVVDEKVTLYPRGALFDSAEKWPFRAPGMKFKATVKDEEFLRDVKSGYLQIREGDRLRVLLRTTRFPDSRRPRREVLEVLEHSPRPEEIPLF